MTTTKKIFIGSLIVVGLVFAYFVVREGVLAYKAYSFQKKTDAFMAVLEKPYREDAYGGKTPEATWAMFMKDLKNEDFESAMAFFEHDKRQKYKDKFLNSKNRGSLPKLLEIYSTFEVESGITGRYAYYHVKTPYDEAPKGYLYSPVVFKLNPFTRIWKISVL